MVYIRFLQMVEEKYYKSKDKSKMSDREILNILNQNITTDIDNVDIYLNDDRVREDSIIIVQDTTKEMFDKSFEFFKV